MDATGRDDWHATDYAEASAGFVWADTGCRWCSGDEDDDRGPCSLACEEEAESEAKYRRLREAREKRGALLKGAIDCLLMAARYVAEGDPFDSVRVVGCIEQGHAWRARAEEWHALVVRLEGRTK